MSSVGIRLVLDQGIGHDAAVFLRDAECDCTHVSEIGMFRADDVEILSWARDHQSIVVTLDADFHTILAVSRASAPSLIRVRMQGLEGRSRRCVRSASAGDVWR